MESAAEAALFGHVAVEEHSFVAGEGLDCGGSAVAGEGSLELKAHPGSAPLPANVIHHLGIGSDCGSPLNRVVIVICSHHG